MFGKIIWGDYQDSLPISRMGTLTFSVGIICVEGKSEKECNESFSASLKDFYCLYFLISQVCGDCIIWVEVIVFQLCKRLILSPSLYPLPFKMTLTPHSTFRLPLSDFLSLSLSLSLSLYIYIYIYIYIYKMVTLHELIFFH